VVVACRMVVVCRIDVVVGTLEVGLGTWLQLGFVEDVVACKLDLVGSFDEKAYQIDCRLDIHLNQLLEECFDQVNVELD